MANFDVCELYVPKQIGIKRYQITTEVWIHYTHIL
jgi:hypothetical protein